MLFQYIPRQSLSRSTSSGQALSAAEESINKSPAKGLRANVGFNVGVHELAIDPDFDAVWSLPFCTYGPETSQSVIKDLTLIDILENFPSLLLRRIADVGRGDSLQVVFDLTAFGSIDLLSDPACRQSRFVGE